jgi:hypothetical protein
MRDLRLSSRRVIRSRAMNRPRLVVLFLLLFGPAALTADAYARAKTDRVFLNNGDRITGEIKKLYHGILELSTDDISTIRIEWDNVDSLNSTYHYRIEDNFGAKLFGAIALTRSGTLQVLQPRQTEEVTQIDVVAITPLERSFWQQLDGSISLGFSYTKSNSLAQLTSDFTVSYRTPIRLIQVDFSSIETSQEAGDTQRREDFAITYRRLFEGPLFSNSLAALQTNDELGLDLRLMFTSGVGAQLFQSNHNELISVAGLSVNKEWSENSEGDYNLEALLSAEHSVFRYDYPKTDITTEIALFPSLSSWGRLRSELDISASREIVSDFVVTLSFYDSYDSDPLDPTAGNNDYGLVTSLGWTF